MYEKKRYFFNFSPISIWAPSDQNILRGFTMPAEPTDGTSSSGPEHNGNTIVVEQSYHSHRCQCSAHASSRYVGCWTEGPTTRWLLPMPAQGGEKVRESELAGVAAGGLVPSAFSTAVTCATPTPARHPSCNLALNKISLSRSSDAAWRLRFLDSRQDEKGCPVRDPLRPGG